jgi:DNA-binding winged helix-turn-helix (wHTH) protein/Flp pilus assembly protein TadD
MSDLRFGEFRLDAADERLWGPHGAVKLGNKAIRVLSMMALQPGRLITKDDLFTSVWDGTIVSESALTSVIKELRRALGDESRTPRFVESVYGRGYRFIAPVERAANGGARAADVRVAQAPPAPEAPAAAGVGAPPLLYIAAPEDAAVRQAHPFLGETLREEILIALSRFRDIRLVSEDAPAPPPSGLGEREYQLSLKLLGHRDRIRAFARLSRLASGTIIWAESLDLGDENAAAFIDQLVRGIVGAAVPSLQDDLLRNLPPQAEDAYSRYFRNKLEMRCRHDLASARALAESWEALIAAHPRFWPAYPPLIRLYNTDFCFTAIGASGPRERERAYALAHQAIGYEPADAHLHTVKAWCHLWAGEAALAGLHLEEALRLNPYNQARLLEAATAFLFLEEMDKAEALLERSRNLMPLATQAPHEEQGLLHLLRGDPAAAAAELALVRRAHPEDAEVMEPTAFSELYALLAAAEAGAPDLPGRSKAWRERMARAWQGEGEPDDASLIAWALRHNPFRTEARRQWLVSLLGRALAAGRDSPRTPAPASRGKRSGPRADSSRAAPIAGTLR